MTINYLTTDSSKLRHLITRRSPTTETQQPIDHKWSVKPILRSIQIYAGIALRFDLKSDLRRAMKPGPGHQPTGYDTHNGVMTSWCHLKWISGTTMYTYKVKITLAYQILSLISAIRIFAFTAHSSQNPRSSDNKILVFFFFKYWIYIICLCLLLHETPRYCEVSKYCKEISSPIKIDNLF